MGLPYATQDDAYMRLNNTICMYNGQPVYVQVARDDRHEVVITTMKDTPKSSRIKYTEETFDYKPTPLGYMNYGGSTTYMVRIPSRQQKQGLEFNNITSLGREPVNRHWFQTSDFAKCILGEHPPYVEALDKMNEGIHGCAFHRYVALVWLNPHQLGLEYRGHLVGSRGTKDHRFTLFNGPDYSYLVKQLPTFGVPL